MSKNTNEKKQKIPAGEYFNGCELFKVDVTPGHVSHQSSSATYSIECLNEECGKQFTRRGNHASFKLNSEPFKCPSCNMAWRREDNTIIKPEVKVEGAGVQTRSRATKAQSEEPTETAEVPKLTQAVDKLAEKAEKKALKDAEKAEKKALKDADKAMKTKKPSDKTVNSAQAIIDVIKQKEADNKQEIEPPPHDINSIAARLMQGRSYTPSKPTATPSELKPDEYLVDGIVDYYDDYDKSNKRWYRFYYVKWAGSDEMTFTRSDKFTDKGVMAAKYEKQLPLIERFTSVFKNPYITQKWGSERVAARTKADVLAGLKSDVDDVDEIESETRTIKFVYIKNGNSYFNPETDTFFMLNTDRKSDKVKIHII